MLEWLPVTPPDEAGKVFAVVLGAVVQQLREQRGWTQGELAALVGLNQSAVSRIERGQAHPEPFELRGLAEAFGMTTANFTATVDTAFARAQATARNAIGGGDGDEWWKTLLLVLGIVGVVGLAAFVVATVLGEGRGLAKKGKARGKGVGRQGNK